MKHTKKFQEDLFTEMKRRIKEDDRSVPYKLNGYWYITKFKKGNDYPIYTRKKGSLKAKEELLFDCNKMAKGHSYFKLGGISISPDNTLACFSVDTVSRRQYTLKFKNLVTGKIYDEKILNTTGTSTWATVNRSETRTAWAPLCLSLGMPRTLCGARFIQPRLNPRQNLRIQRRFRRSLRPSGRFPTNQLH